MSIEIKVPDVAESITEVTIAEWLKKDGEYVEADEAIVELETDKASQELFAEGAGTLKVLVQEGETVEVGAIIARIESGADAPDIPAEPEQASTSEDSPNVSDEPKVTGEVIEMKVTPFAESLTEVTIGEWLKADGDFVELDEGLCEIETDKATQELPAEASGILRIIAQEGETLKIGDLICKIEVAEAPAASPQTSDSGSTVSATSATTQATSSNQTYATGHPSPAASKILSEKGIDPSQVKGTGIDGRITKEDAQKAQVAAKTTSTPSDKKASDTVSSQAATQVTGERGQSRKRMSALRRTIARRLVSVKNETAMLTTFNEVNMKPVMDMRKKYKEAFKEKHNVGLGFMSFFTKACAEALMTFRDVNAMIDGNEIVYNDFVDISVAVSAPKGLVVPVLRNVEQMNFADIERGILDLALKARDNQLTIEEMTGGTFTISNGGIFGSMMSTPIINAPQSAILGMHNIVQRPVVIDGEIVIRPMMYLALSYDHRIIDGREAVGFLVKVKEYVEAPEKLLFGI